MIRNAEDSVTLMGKLGSAPETKSLASGKMLVLNLGVQVVSCTTDETGQRQSTEKTSWHRVISFDPRVIACAQGLEKDDIVALRGYPEQRMFEKDGKRQFIFEFVAEELDPIRTKRVPSVVPTPFPVDTRRPKGADLLRITVELLPGGREAGARVISRGSLPLSSLADLPKALGGPNG
ncbi:MAG: hypothetical protein C0484_02610 [Rhodospirillum sp.]|nr:hypothetical protein [Rhodospirillum sp.]